MLQNDSAMFAFVKRRLVQVMGNAITTTRQKHATHVTDSNERDGFLPRDGDRAEAHPTVTLFGNPPLFRPL
jgi:hypothetical protein